MPESIDELYARWQQNPDTAHTISLCEALRGTSRTDLVDIVGSHASRQLDVGALLAAARMYTEGNRLDDAQATLLAAGRLAPRDGNVYRWLGEVLLRRGDAERAEKVLERAVAMGADDAAKTLLDRARMLIPTQLAVGTQAVVGAVTEALARGPLSVPSMPPPRGEAPAPAPAFVAVPAAAPPPAPERSRPAHPRPPPQIKPSSAKMKAALDAPAPPAPPPVFRAPPTPPPPQTENIVIAPASQALPPSVPAEARPASLSQPTSLGLGFGDPPPPSPSAANVANLLEPLRASPVAVPAAAPPKRHPLAFDADAGTATGGIGGIAKMPDARDVLDALQVSGIYEADAAGKPQTFAWSPPEKGKRRIASLATLITLAVVLLGGGIGTYFYVTDKRAKQHLVAEDLLKQVDKDLLASDAKLLEPSEKVIGRAFDLESRSAHASLTWLHERAIVGLLKGGADIAFEDSMSRAKAVGIEEKSIAFANVASFLFQGDTAGAAAMIAKWDSAAQNDAWFQLLAGATFERAGDVRAIERYEAAVKLEPSLVVAEIARARVLAVDGDPRRAAELAKEFRAKHPDRVEGVALVALTWARDPMRGEPTPEVKEIVTKVDALPLGLAAVPHASKAMLALESHGLDDAKAALTKALSVADTPGIAAWIGSIALTTGDEQLARKAALAAVSFSAVYPPARVLAARVALLGARLDEALKAAEDLAPTSPDVAIVTAAVSYERLDGERMARAFEPLPEDAKKLPFIAPLVRGQALMAGNLAAQPTGEKAVNAADDDAPWADLVTMDAALDAGDIDTGAKIAAQWKSDVRALRAVRLARLHRYEGKLEEADRYSKAALEGGTVTMRALAERVFTLVALKKEVEAISLFKTYPNVGGPLAKWLRAYATAAHGKIEEAKAIVGQEDPPSTAAPMFARIIAASAYAQMKDNRHGGEYVRPIAAAGFGNPDVAFAAEKLGAGKVGPRRR